MGFGRGPDPLHQARNPYVTHGVSKLFAIDVTFELLSLLLYPCSPIVLDLIVCPTRQVLRYLGPPVNYNVSKTNNPTKLIRF